jgi:hypothetical protein
LELDLMLETIAVIVNLGVIVFGIRWIGSAVLAFGGLRRQTVAGLSSGAC